MTSREYDLSRLEALPLAVKKIEAVRLIVSTTNAPAWDKLYRAGEAIKRQLGAEFSAYFAEDVPDPEPPRLWPAVLKSAIVKAHAEANGITVIDVPVAPELDDADLKGLPGLESLLDTVRTEARATPPPFAQVEEEAHK